MADLFSATKQNTFAEEELSEDSVVKESLTTAADGKAYSTKLYNPDAILALGYVTPHFVSTKGASRYQHSPSAYDSRRVRNIGLKDRWIVCMAEAPPPSIGLSDLVNDLSFIIALRTMLVSNRSLGAEKYHMPLVAPKMRLDTSIARRAMSVTQPTSQGLKDRWKAPKVRLDTSIARRAMTASHPTSQGLKDGRIFPRFL